MKHICPVCGYPDLNEPPYLDNNPSYEICNCCGFEFGYDDGSEGHNYISYRAEWIAGGAKWFIPKSCPSNWSLTEQLKNIE